MLRRANLRCTPWFRVTAAMVYAQTLQLSETDLEVGMKQMRLRARRALRSVVVVPTKCERPWGRVESVLLADISQGGCRIDALCAPLDRGARVLIRTADLVGAAGTVRWADKASAGIQFDALLAAETVHHLERNYACGTTLIVLTPAGTGVGGATV